MDELLQALAYLAYPYRWPVVGWRGDLDAITAPDLVSYFRSYYIPSNAVILISGDFDTAAARKLVERWFAAIPAGTPPPPVVNAEPVPRGERRTVLLGATRSFPRSRSAGAPPRSAPPISTRWT